MTKEEAKNKLRQIGYTVTNDNSVVTVLIADNGNIRSTVKAVKEKLKEIGYEASFSVRVQKEAENYSNDKSLDDAVTDGSDIELSVGPVKDIDPIEDKKDASDPENEKNDEAVEENTDKKPDEDNADDDTEYFDEEDSNMILGEDAIQFSLDDFGLDY